MSKLRFFVSIAAIASFAATLLAADQSRDPSTTLGAGPSTALGAGQKLQQAIDLIESKGNPTRAIPLLEDVAKSTDRTLAARALLYLGQAQERLGQEQARRTYERILRDYAAQAEIVAQARNRLVALGAATPVKGSERTVQRSLWTVPQEASVHKGISSDGRFIAYSDDSICAVLVRDMATGTVHQVDRGECATGYPENGQVAFSSDNRRLAYTRRADGYDQLRVVAVNGAGRASPRNVLDSRDVRHVEAIAWTPDGAWIAVKLQRQGFAGLAMIRAEDGFVRVVKAIPTVGAAALSPDGRYLAFDAPAPPTASPSGPGATSVWRDIHLVAIDGTRQLAAVVHPDDDALIGWSPDGTQLLFLSDRSGQHAVWSSTFLNGQFSLPERRPEQFVRFESAPVTLGITKAGIWYYTSLPPTESVLKMADFDPGEGRFVSSAVDIGPSQLGRPAGTRWSHDGNYLALFSPDKTLTLGIRSLATGEVRELRVALSEVVRYTGADPRWGWTPDNRGIWLWAVDKSVPGTYRIDATTGEVSTLLMQDQLASWPPPGTKMYFWRITPGAQPPASVGAIVERDVTSTAEHKLFDLFAGGSTPWHAPDFSRRYSLIPRGGSRVLVERRSDGTERDLIPEIQAPLSVSPDGRYAIAQVIDPASKAKQVRLFDLNTGSVRELLRIGPTDPPLSNDGTWSRDSRSFIARRLGSYWWFPVDGRPPHRIELPFAPNWNGRQEWSENPVGRQVVFGAVSPQPKAQVWVLENFLTPPPSSR